VGAQTVILAKNSPDAEITSIDIFESSINQPKELIRENRIETWNLSKQIFMTCLLKIKASIISSYVLF